MVIAEYATNHDRLHGHLSRLQLDVLSLEIDIHQFAC